MWQIALENIQKLNAAKATITTLESTVQQLRGAGSDSGSLAAKIQVIKDAAKEDLRQYQKESECAFNSNLCHVRVVHITAC